MIRIRRLPNDTLGPVNDVPRVDSLAHRGYRRYTVPRPSIEDAAAPTGIGPHGKAIGRRREHQSSPSSSSVREEDRYTSAAKMILIAANRASTSLVTYSSRSSCWARCSMSVVKVHLWLGRRVWASTPRQVDCFSIADPENHAFELAEAARVKWPLPEHEMTDRIQPAGNCAPGTPRTTRVLSRVNT